MKQTKEYTQYQSFLNSIEREVTALMSMSNPEEQLAMFRVAEMVIEQFRKIYGDGDFNAELLRDTELILENYKAELN